MANGLISCYINKLHKTFSGNLLCQSWVKYQHLGDASFPLLGLTWWMTRELDQKMGMSTTQFVTEHLSSKDWYCTNWVTFTIMSQYASNQLTSFRSYEMHKVIPVFQLMSQLIQAQPAHTLIIVSVVTSQSFQFLNHLGCSCPSPDDLSTLTLKSLLF
jgi:hypothetical protein